MHSWKTNRKTKKKIPPKKIKIVMTTTATVENAARKKTLRALNYHGGDYIGPRPSRRSILLDRARKSKQPWEKAYRKGK